MLSNLGTISEARPGQKRRKQAKSVDFYIARRGGQPIAVIERRGKTTSVMLALTRKAPQYRPRYDFFGSGARQVAVSFPRHFDRILRRYASKVV